jgi:hypothetical protein
MSSGIGHSLAGGGSNERNYWYRQYPDQECPKGLMDTAIAKDAA